jgi:hypothetical protein
MLISHKEGDMKYLYLLYADESGAPTPGSPDMNQLLDAYGKFFQEVSAADVLRGGDPVQPSATATTVRVRDGATRRAPGPHSPEGEQVIGYYVLECASDDEAAAYAARIPAAAHGAVEVRPILDQG